MDQAYGHRIEAQNWSKTLSGDSGEAVTPAGGRWPPKLQHLWVVDFSEAQKASNATQSFLKTWGGQDKVMTQVFPLTSWYVYGADKICAIVFLISLMASKQEGLIAFGPDIIDMM